MGLYQKFLWYRHRIGAMSGPEIFHRAKEMAKRKHDRYRGYSLIPEPYDYGPFRPIPGLRERLSDWNVPQTLLAEWEEHAKLAQAGEFFLLGQAWPKSDTPKKWHLDPVTGKYWPKDRYCFDLNFRHDDTMGDVKYVWELGRLQYLQPVAALAFKRNDVALATFCIEAIESWIDENPPFLGIHWSSGIELALRAVSILVVTTLLGEHLTSTQRVKIWHTLETHAMWLERYPSKFSSANNHLTAEGLGLFIIGTLCPSFKRAKRWQEHGWELLCDTARLQIFADGVGAEQTISYTAVVLEMLLLGLHIAQHHQISIPDYYPARIALGGEYLRWFTDEGGNQPRIGDDDNARVLGCYRRDEHYTRSILACIASITRRPDLTPPHVESHLRQALFGFPPQAANPPMGMRSFEHGGYTVGRHETMGRHILLAMDHGPLGYLSIAAHGHADALALWLHIDNQPVLVDAGTYLYHSGGTQRNHFRGTAAHNTLRLEKTDSSILSGHFNWSHKANSQLNTIEHANDYWRVEAEHDGYLKRFGVVHKRRLEVTPAVGFFIEDTLVGSQPHFVEISFLLHPSLSIFREGSDITIHKGAQPLLQLYQEGPLTPYIHLADSSECGWYSPTFAVKEPAARIVFSGVLAPNQKAITRFSFTA